MESDIALRSTFLPSRKSEARRGSACRDRGGEVAGVEPKEECACEAADAVAEREGRAEHDGCAKSNREVEVASGRV
jgi:hypothetical protein